MCVIHYGPRALARQFLSWRACVPPTDDTLTLLDATPEQAAKDPKALRLNCAQRAHGNSNVV